MTEKCVLLTIIHYCCRWGHTRPGKIIEVHHFFSNEFQLAIIKGYQTAIFFVWSLHEEHLESKGGQNWSKEVSQVVYLL